MKEIDIWRETVKPPNHSERMAPHDAFSDQRVLAGLHGEKCRPASKAGDRFKSNNFAGLVLMEKPRLADVDRVDVGALVRLLAVVQYGSISRSALQMNTAQPTLARRIRRLEAALGHDLLQRNKDGVSVTSFGLTIIEHARAIEHSLASIIQLAEKANHSDKEVCIGATPLAALYFLPDIVSAATTAGMRMKFRIVEGDHSDILADLRIGNLDIAVAPASANERQLQFKSLFRVRLGIIASASHPLLAKPALCVADLQDARWALSNSDTSYRQRVETDFARGQLPPLREVMQTPSPSSLLRLVRATDTLTVLPIELVQSELRADELVILKGDWRFSAYSYGTFTRRAAPPNATLQQLTELIHRVAGRLQLPRSSL